MLISTDKKKKILPFAALHPRNATLLLWLVVAGLTVLAFFMRRKGLATQSLWFDEADLLARARRDLGTLAGDFLKPGENGPLYTLFMNLWIKLAGTGEAALRTPSLLAGTAVVPLIYALGRRFLGGWPVGLVAATLVAISPYQLWYSQDAKMYPLALLLTLASVYLFLAALEKNRRSLWVAYVVLTTLSFYVHLMSVLIVAVEVFYYWLSRGHRPQSRRALVSLGLLTLPYLPIALWQARALWDGGIGNTWFQPVGPFDMLNNLARRFGVNRIPDPFWEGVGAVFYAALALLGLIVVWRTTQPSVLTNQNQEAEPGPEPANRPDPARAALPDLVAVPATFKKSSALLLTLYLVLPVVAFYLLTTRIPLFADRYLLIASPAYYLLVAWGLVWLARRVWPVAILSGLAALVLAGAALFSYNYSEAPQKEEWREAMRWLQGQVRPGDEVIVLPGYLTSAVDYYFKPQDVPVYTIPQELLDGHDQAALSTYLLGDKGILRDRERAWLVVSPDRYEKEDPRQYLRKTWFDYNTWMFEHPRTFVGVQIYGYAFKRVTGADADFYPRSGAGMLTQAQFGSSLRLEGFDFWPTAVPGGTARPGEVSYDSELHLTLYWRKLTEDATKYEVAVRLLDRDGQDTGTNYAAQPLEGYYSTDRWKVREAVRDYRDLYIKVPPGEYRLEVSVYPLGQPQNLLLVSGTQGSLKIEPGPTLQLAKPIKVTG